MDGMETSSNTIDMVTEYTNRLEALKEHIERRLRPGAIASASAAELAELQTAIQTLTLSPIEDSTVMRAYRAGLQLTGAASFRVEMARHFEAAKLESPSAAYFLNDKRAGYAFADILKVARPELIGAQQRFEDLRVDPPQTVKLSDSAGGSGVYLVSSKRHIRHAQDGRVFSSWPDFEEHARALAKKRERRGKADDTWLTEKLIVEPETPGVVAHDFKVYCCYGEPQLGLEIWRHPEKQYRFYTPDGRPAPLVSVAPHLAGTVAEATTKFADTQHFAEAARISKEIPVPFVSIDFLVTTGERYLGEFTPKPGIFAKFNVQWDRKLGEAVLRAERRLIADLVTGKRFGPYTEFKESFEPSAILV